MKDSMQIFSYFNNKWVGYEGIQTSSLLIDNMYLNQLSNAHVRLLCNNLHIYDVLRQKKNPKNYSSIFFLSLIQVQE